MATGQLDAVDLDVDRLKEVIAGLEHDREELYGEIEQLQTRVTELRTQDIDLTDAVRAQRAGG